MIFLPEVFRLYGYKIYFYANENNEPCHVHISKSPFSSSKVWIEPEIKVEHNKAQIPKKDLKKILSWLEKNKNKVLQQWNEFFGN